MRYPLKLDMAPYLTTNLEYPAAYKPCVVPLPPRLLLGGSRVRALITPVARRSDAHRFNLMAVIAHEGTLSQGHYTAYVRGSDDVRPPLSPLVPLARRPEADLALSLPRLQFFAIDDDKVRRVRISEVLAAKAYLVVYSRA